MKENLCQRKLFRRSIRIVLAISAFVFNCSLASHVDAQNVVSRPAGFIRVTLSTNSYTSCSIPFKAFDDSVNAILKDQLTGAGDETLADRILKWDAFMPGYVEALKRDVALDPSVNGKWVTEFASDTLSQMTLKPGEGFFIHNRQQANQDVFLAGEVVLSPANTMLLLPSVNLFGFPYATAVDINDTGLSRKPPVDSILDPANANNSIDGQLKLGQSYWYDSAGDIPMVWTEVRPYADLFPQTGVPAIQQIQVADEGAAVEVSVNVQGLGDATLDIFYQDVTASNRFDTVAGWQIADADIQVTDQSVINWKDLGSDNRSPVNQVYARYYLVARSDVDVDRSGVSDAREFFVEGITKAGKSHGWSKDDKIKEESLLVEETVAATNVVAITSGASTKWTVGKIIYVDKRIGKDMLSGRAPVIVDADGPKNTIAAGLAEARSGDTVIIREGTYSESIRTAGRNLKIKIRGKVKLSGGNIVTAPAIISPTRPPVMGVGSSIVPVITLPDQQINVTTNLTN